MSRPSTNERLLEMIRKLRLEGLDVARVVVDGGKIEIELAQKDAPQRIDGVKW